MEKTIELLRNEAENILKEKFISFSGNIDDKYNQNIEDLLDCFYKIEHYGEDNTDHRIVVCR